MTVMSKEQCRISSQSARIRVLERKNKELKEENEKLRDEQYFDVKDIRDIPDSENYRNQLRLSEQRNAALRKEIRELKEEVDFLRRWSNKLSDVNSDCIRNNAKYIKAYRELKEELAQKVNSLRDFNRQTFRRSLERAKQLKLIQMVLSGDVYLDTRQGEIRRKEKD